MKNLTWDFYRKMLTKFSNIKEKTVGAAFPADKYSILILYILPLYRIKVNGVFCNSPIYTNPHKNSHKNHAFHHYIYAFIPGIILNREIGVILCALLLKLEHLPLPILPDI